MTRSNGLATLDLVILLAGSDGHVFEGWIGEPIHILPRLLERRGEP